jgi:peptidyl-prolyl cis-trans isomerase C
MSLVFRSRAGLAVMASALLTFASVQQLAAEEESPVVAIVNGETITEADLALAAQDFRETLAQLPPEQRLMGLINGLIDIRLMARAAETQGLDKDEAAARRLSFIHDRALRSEYLKVNVLEAITEDAVKKLYDEQLAAFTPEEEVRASHILVETEDEAKAIIAKLDGGADFAQLAKDSSLDLGSGANGGDLDFFGRGRMVPPFEAAAFTLEPGTYTKTPVKSDFGWHVILVVEKRMSTPPTIEAMQDALREEVARQLFVAALDKLRSEAKIEIVAPEDEAPATEAPASDAPADPAAPQ